MKTYERLKLKKPAEFKRLVDVKKETFQVILEVYSEYHEKKKQTGVLNSEISRFEAKSSNLEGQNQKVV